MEKIKREILFLLVVVILAILYFKPKYETERYVHGIEFIKSLKQKDH